MDTQPTAKIAAALAAFQAEMPRVAKGKRATVPTKTGSSYTYTYADLADVSEAALPILTKHELAFACCPRLVERGGYELAGQLLHSSGEVIEGALPIAGNSPQEIGSSLTYMRRYLFGCLTGLVTDDDDDGRLAGQAKKQPQRKPAKKSADTGELVTDNQLKAMHTGMSKRGLTEREDRLKFVITLIGRDVASSKELTRKEAGLVLDELATGQSDEPSMDTPGGVDPWATT